jgi:hypothetical protein
VSLDRRLLPNAGDVAAIGAAALLLRVAVFVTMTVAGGRGVRSYAEAGDGLSYERYAAAMVGDRSQWTDYDKRVFPGYPAMIAAAHLVTRLDFGLCALLVTWISAAVAAAMSAVLFQDRRVGWAMVMLLPHWPINSSLAMSEAPMLALTVCGLTCGVSGMAAPAGVALGMAMAIRPVAVFPLAGLLAAQWLSSQRREAAVTAILGGLVVFGGLQWVQWLTGDALHSFKTYASLPGAYSGPIFTFPFGSLLQTTFFGHASLARIAYVWTHVLLALAACLLLWRQARRQQRADRLEIVALLWLTGNTLFTLCIASGPFGWGFYHFPRFMIPATPAILWAMRRGFPAAAWFWMLLAAAMFLPTAAGVREALLNAPLSPVFAR